jgi:hypothetical protein
LWLRIILKLDAVCDFKVKSVMNAFKEAKIFVLPLTLQNCISLDEVTREQEQRKKQLVVFIWRFCLRIK